MDRYLIQAPSELMAVLNKPIDFKYEQPSTESINALREQSTPCQIKRSNGIVPFNIYHKENRAGTRDKMFTRHAVLTRLEQVATQLAPDFSLLLFDTYRSIKTQTELFNFIRNKVKQQHPSWQEDQVEHETRKFVSHPTDSNHFKIPLHNSGGAVDLTICDASTEEPYLFGSEFDEISDLSRTDFFEQAHDPSIGITLKAWQAYKLNRRILYHLMINAGFINYRSEWWHYDLGDCLWARELETDWIFDSMEKQLNYC